MGVREAVKCVCVWLFVCVWTPVCRSYHAHHITWVLRVQVLFRGFLLPCLAKQMHVNAAVLSSAVVFAALHWVRQDFVPLTLLGTVWGALYAASGSLSMPVLLHCFWNLLTIARLAGWMA